MLLTDNLVFIHIPKTGGMSCANYLLRALEAPVYNCHAAADREATRIRRKGVVPVTEINRHCTLQQAEKQVHSLLGKSICDLPMVLAVIRHPFTLEYSFYMHLRKPGVIRRRSGDNPDLVELAQGDFKTFVARAGYHRNGLRQEDYFLIEGKLPDNLALIRFETMATALPQVVAPYARKRTPAEFPHRNSSGAGLDQLEQLLDEETRALVYRKHAYLFDQGYYSLTGWR